MLRQLKKALKSCLYSTFQNLARDFDPAKDLPGLTLVIAPHPDDESLGCGATIARLHAAGGKIVVLVVTDGGASAPAPNGDKKPLIARRQLETLEAVAALGLKGEDVRFLAIADRSAEGEALRLEALLRLQLKELQPTCLFSPFGDDGHPDHRAIASVIDALAKKGEILCPIYEYPIWFWSGRALTTLLKPHILSRLRRAPTAPFLAAKRAAIMAHRSQHEAQEGIEDWFAFPPGFLDRFLDKFELFFEKPLRRQ